LQRLEAVQAHTEAALPIKGTIEIQVTFQAEALAALSDQRHAVADEQGRVVPAKEAPQSLSLPSPLGALDQGKAVLDAINAEVLVGGDGDVRVDHAEANRVLADEQLSQRAGVFTLFEVALDLSHAVVEIEEVVGRDERAPRPERLGARRTVQPLHACARAQDERARVRVVMEGAADRGPNG